MAYDCPDFVNDLSRLFCTNCPDRRESCDDPDEELENLFECIKEFKESYDAALDAVSINLEE